ncbi:MAG: antibiotic biosynthesis monooxygenase [Actinobacteria bacterium]|nr:MAG: antibiotic biosynthesis monooxygenase [Actinomycetota bacterium]
MISRIWHGWTDRSNADAYEEMLRSVVLPGIGERINGYLGVYVLRRDDGDEVEFVTVTMFASYDAIRSFAGDNFEGAVLEPEAKKLLSRFQERVKHYETVLAPD